MRIVDLESDIEYLKQMVIWIDKISARLDFVKRKGLSLDDEMVIDSLAMNLGQIGEQLSAGKLSEQIRERYSDLIPWRKIKAFRNIAYHTYDSVDSFTVKQIVFKQLPKLKDDLEFIIFELNKELSER